MKGGLIAIFCAALFSLSGRIHIADTTPIPRATYDTVSLSFLMLAREDVKDGESVWL
jgi:hypothetical protein